MDVQNLVNAVQRTALSFGEMLTPVLKESKFRETGVITPEEFVAAGDHLIHTCSTWSWSKADDKKRNRDYLPEDKQFLLMRNVPCHKRCRQMEYDQTQEKILSSNEMGAAEGFAGDEDSGWVDTHHFAQPAAAVQSLDLVQGETEMEEDEGELDLDDFVTSGAIDNVDPNKYVAATTTTAVEMERPRTYDLHICYDKFYQVPRLYLMGYDENRRALTVEQTYEDFSAVTHTGVLVVEHVQVIQFEVRIHNGKMVSKGVEHTSKDHVNKTITVEAHTSLDCSMPSIHPCKHGDMMKRLLEQCAENGKDIGVHEYLLLFLRFVQTVIPTIEYDYTRSIKL